MTQDIQSINSHIDAYLDYYCALPQAPGFAVLLKGKWGSGKTWFINRYCEKLKNRNQKYLKVSLYGVTTFSEIEDAFFQQLHPRLSSKEMAIAWKIFKGVVKIGLRFDLDNDGKDETTLNSQIPEINLPEYLKGTDKNVLIFDDLERCDIDIKNILGYINYFVEHQGLKVVIIAEEDKLLDRDVYKDIREKLIGKTFSISLDFEGALENFITVVNNPWVRGFLSQNTDLLESLYKKAEHENLRSLRIAILDFERIFNELPEKAKIKLGLLQELLQVLLAFSIEIKAGNMFPKDIEKLQEEYMSRIRKSYSSSRLVGSASSEKIEEKTSLQNILDKYSDLNLQELFPSSRWWQTFFDKGILDTQELENSLQNSKYFQNDNTPNWFRLLHYSSLSDDDFEKILREVELEYKARKFLEIGEIKHIFGLLLVFSDAEVYVKSKEDILTDAKLYIDHLKNNNHLPLTLSSTYEVQTDSYRDRGFQGRDLKEFKELISYILEVQESARAERMPSAAQDLLRIMKTEKRNFHKMLTSNPSYDYENTLIQNYQEFPILNYIEPDDFVETLLLLEPEDQQQILWSLSERYKLSRVNEKLIDELEWLKHVRLLLLKQANSRKGKLSGFNLKSWGNYYLTRTIEALERLA